MSIIVNLYYTGENGISRKFAEEMESSGIAEKSAMNQEIGRTVISCHLMIRKLLC